MRETKAANPCKGERYNWPIAETLLGQNDVATRLYHRATPSKALPSCLSSGLGPTYKRSLRLISDEGSLDCAGALSGPALIGLPLSVCLSATGGYRTSIHYSTGTVSGRLPSGRLAPR